MLAGLVPIRHMNMHMLFFMSRVPLHSEADIGDIEGESGHVLLKIITISSQN